MAGSVNRAILVGNLGRDPETRQTQAGKPVTTFTLATSETWKDRQTGERRERTEWHRVVIFNEHLAEIAQRYLRKGSKVYLEGQLQTRTWTDQSGAERQTTEVVLQQYRGQIVMLGDSGNGGGREQGAGASTGAATRAQAPVRNGPANLGPDDDIPF